MPTAVTTLVYLNDKSLADFKMTCTLPQGFLSAPGVSDQLLPVPGRLGHLRVSRESDVGPRRITIRGFFRPTDEAESLSLWDQFLRLVADEELELRFAAWPDRVGYARYEGVEWLNTERIDATVFQLGFVMSNPLKYARTIDVYAIADGAEVALDLGSAPSDVRLRFTGVGAANPQVIYADAQGLIRGSVTFAMTLGAGDWIDFNPDGYGLARHATGTGVTVVDIAPVVNPFFVADPADGDAIQGPTLKAVNARVVAMVRKAWR